MWFACSNGSRFWKIWKAIDIVSYSSVCESRGTEVWIHEYEYILSHVYTVSHKNCTISISRITLVDVVLFLTVLSLLLLATNCRRGWYDTDDWCDTARSPQMICCHTTLWNFNVQLYNFSFSQRCKMKWNILFLLSIPCTMWNASCTWNFARWFVAACSWSSWQQIFVNDGNVLGRSNSRRSAAARLSVNTSSFINFRN